MALDTVTDYISDARTLLQDIVQPYRYADSELLVAFNVTILEGLRLRPDLFFGGSFEFGVIDLTLVPIEHRFRLAFVYGTVAHALARDQEDIQDERSSAFMRTFIKMLTSVDTTPLIAPSSKGP